MKKIRLNVETLAVESFETMTPRDERGTVDGQQITTATRLNNCTQTTCPPNYCFCTEDRTCRCV